MRRIGQTVAPAPAVQPKTGVLKLRLVFDIAMAIDPQNESAPYLHIWPTRNVTNGIASLPLKLHPVPSAKNVIPGSHTGRVDVTIAYQTLDAENRQDGPMRAASFQTQVNSQLMLGREQNLSAPVDVVKALSMACINVDGFTMTMNDHNERCSQQAGVSRIALAELVGDFGNSSNEDRRIATRMTFPMLDCGTARPWADKGQIIFLASQCSATLDGRDVNDLIKERGLKWTVPHRPSNPCAGYISSCRRDFRAPNLPPTWESMADVNIFEYVCGVGILPALAYINAPRGYTGAEFFRNAALVALARMKLTEADAMKWNLKGSDTDCRHASYWLAHTLSLYVQYGDYVSDVVYAYNQQGRRWVKEPVEYFYNARVRGGQGDCEDLSLEFVIQAQEIKRLATTDPLLVRLKQVLSDGFYVVMLLAGISGAEINLQNPGADLGAHMNAALVNKRKLSNWVKKSGQQLCKEHGPKPEELEAAKLYPPMVILEGTGPLNPNGIEDAQGDQGGEALAGAAFRQYPLVDKQIRPMFHYSAKGDQSAFYKTVNVMLTDALVKEGCGQGIWALCQRNSRSNALTCSVEFRTIAAASDDIVALPEPELSAEQLQLLDHYMLDLHPTPSLEPPSALPEQAPQHVLRAREQMKWIEGKLAGLTSSAGNGSQKTIEVIRIIKYAHLADDRKFMSQFIQAIGDILEGRVDNRRHVLKSYEVREEPVTRDRGGYFITLNFS